MEGSINNEKKEFGIYLFREAAYSPIFLSIEEICLVSQS